MEAEDGGGGAGAVDGEGAGVEEGPTKDVEVGPEGDGDEIGEAVAVGAAGQERKRSPRGGVRVEEVRVGEGRVLGEDAEEGRVVGAAGVDDRTVDG